MNKLLCLYRELASLYGLIWGVGPLSFEQLVADVNTVAARATTNT